MKGARLLVFISVFIFSCSEDDQKPEIPVVLSPIEGKVYYPDQEIPIRWEVRDSTKTVRLQMFSSETKNDFELAETIFSAGGGDLIEGRSSYIFMTAPFSENPVYYYFRLRQEDQSGKSDWTEIHTFTVKPYSALDTEDVMVTATFSFHAAETNEYYSALVNSSNSINLKSVLEQQGVDLTRLEFIKPDSGYITDDAGYAIHLQRVAFGFNTAPDQAFPFDVWGDAPSIEHEPQVNFYPFGGLYRNLYAEIGGKVQPMQAAYFLSDNYELSEMIGKPHHMVITLRLTCYLRKE